MYFEKKLCLQRDQYFQKSKYFLSLKKETGFSNCLLGFYRNPDPGLPIQVTFMEHEEGARMLSFTRQSQFKNDL